MKRLSCFVLSVLACSPMVSQASVCTKKPGFTQCGHGTVNHNITANGMAELDNTTINAKLEVNGTLNARDAYVETAMISGTCDLNRVTLGGHSQINGTLNAIKSQFQGVLDIGSNKSYLTDSTTRSINVAKSLQTPQQIYLKGETQVNGDITFQSGHGEVYVSSGSSISGQVKGGDVKSI